MSRAAQMVRRTSSGGSPYAVMNTSIVGTSAAERSLFRQIATSAGSGTSSCARMVHQVPIAWIAVSPSASTIAVHSQSGPRYAGFSKKS
jgi:hypothetical protein